MEQLVMKKLLREVNEREYFEVPSDWHRLQVTQSNPETNGGYQKKEQPYKALLTLHIDFLHSRLDESAPPYGSPDPSEIPCVGRVICRVSFMALLLLLPILILVELLVLAIERNNARRLKESSERFRMTQLRTVRRFYPELTSLTYSEILRNYDLQALYDDIGRHRSTLISIRSGHAKR